jgi:hypothetical protein
VCIIIKKNIKKKQTTTKKDNVATCQKHAEIIILNLKLEGIHIIMKNFLSLVAFIAWYTSPLLVGHLTL